MLGSDEVFPDGVMDLRDIWIDKPNPKGITDLAPIPSATTQESQNSAKHMWLSEAYSFHDPHTEDVGDYFPRGVKWCQSHLAVWGEPLVKFATDAFNITGAELGGLRRANGLFREVVRKLGKNQATCSYETIGR